MTLHLQLMQLIKHKRKQRLLKEEMSEVHKMEKEKQRKSLETHKSALDINILSTNSGCYENTYSKNLTNGAC